MKSQYCKKKSRIYDIGFIDPYYIHEVCVKEHSVDTENCLFDALVFSETKREILFPYNFE